jgi:hypothetical protein
MPQKIVFARKELKKIILSVVPQENWFYYKHGSNTKKVLALKICYKNQFDSLKRWISAKQNILNSRESLK